MTICRYFAQGYCRFGDRCRFEHVQNDYNYEVSSNNTYNQRNVGGYLERYGGQESRYSNYNRNERYENQYRNQRYEPTYYHNEDNRSYSPQRYTENYRYQSPARSSGYDNQQHNAYRQGYEQQLSHNKQNYGRNQQKQHFNYQRDNENAYGQNRFRWLSDDYKKQNHPRVEHRESEHVDESYMTSTPKVKSAFSFKLPESEIKKGASSFFKVNEQDQLHAEMVKEDAKSWELGGQWPFTCYFPYANKHGFPGFYDVSPEELRFTAYKAEKDNSYETYLQSVQNAISQVNQQRSQLQTATPELLSTLRRIRDGEDLYSTSKMIDPIPEIHRDNTVIESMETPSYLDPVSSAAASFSFKLPTETDSAVKASASSFSFKLSAGTEIHAIPSTASDGDTEIYTPLASLTDEEKEQFLASTFVLGKIPTKPPPQVLCN